MHEQERRHQDDSEHGRRNWRPTYGAVTLLAARAFYLRHDPGTKSGVRLECSCVRGHQPPHLLSRVSQAWTPPGRA